ncbi:hypothetical protein [Actinomadura sp. RB99]|uniref:hypothetical protein n=1 Tax=Actinomadura sp. RB99 TaxID=2691577 RepID=UPI0019D644A7|nr:hypothetical protein [Actinomadura sp. RB99]
MAGADEVAARSAWPVGRAIGEGGELGGDRDRVIDDVADAPAGIDGGERQISRIDPIKEYVPGP